MNKTATRKRRRDKTPDQSRLPRGSDPLLNATAVGAYLSRSAAGVRRMVRLKLFPPAELTWGGQTGCWRLSTVTKWVEENLHKDIRIPEVEKK